MCPCTEVQWVFGLGYSSHLSFQIWWLTWSDYFPRFFFLSLSFGLWLSLTDLWRALIFFFSLSFSLSIYTSELSCKCSAKSCCGVIGLSTKFFPFHLMVYWFVRPHCRDERSYCHGLPNSRWHTIMGATSHSMVSTYSPTLNGTFTLCAILIEPELFSHCTWYGWGCFSNDWWRV